MNGTGRRRREKRYTETLWESIRMATLGSCSWGSRSGSFKGPWSGREKGHFRCSVPGPDSQNDGF